MSKPVTDNLLQSLDYSIVQQCMHCGMCLPTCPTYDETQRERNSPRGRIALMRSVADGRLPVDEDFADEMAYCVGCLACQTACPAGVNYAELLETSRAEIERTGVVATPVRSFYRWLSLRMLFTRPRLLRIVGRLVAWQQRPVIRKALYRLGLMYLAPPNLRRLEPSAPTIRPPFSNARIAQTELPPGGIEQRYRVALLTGCVQDLSYAHVNRSTADVLLANGCEVHTPSVQSCCGSLHAHNGDLETARLLAKRNLDQFDPTTYDAIVSNAGGCGSHLRHYGSLLKDDPAYAQRAVLWDQKLKDVQEWLVGIGLRAPKTNGTPQEQIVTYDDSCHLRHGQGVHVQPRKILEAIPGFRLVPLPEADWCCGSAGVYSVTQPEQAEKLLNRKLDHLESTGATILATANPGCQLQLANGVQARGLTIEVVHPVELLAQAYAAEEGS